MSQLIKRQQYFASGERDSGVEHLVHMTKIAQTHSNFENIRPPAEAPSPMALRHRIRVVEEERRIRDGNAALFDRIRASQSDHERKRNHANLVPTNEDFRFTQGTNKTARANEAKRIDEENTHMIERICCSKPTLTKDRHYQQSLHHKKLLSQISKFRPDPLFAGATILCGSRAKPDSSTSVTSSPRYKEVLECREHEWQTVRIQDVPTNYKSEDKVLLKRKQEAEGYKTSTAREDSPQEAPSSQFQQKALKMISAADESAAKSAARRPREPMHMATSSSQHRGPRPPARQKAKINEDKGDSKPKPIPRPKLKPKKTLEQKKMETDAEERKKLFESENEHLEELNRRERVQRETMHQQEREERKESKKAETNRLVAEATARRKHEESERTARKKLETRERHDRQVLQDDLREGAAKILKEQDAKVTAKRAEVLEKQRQTEEEAELEKEHQRKRSEEEDKVEEENLDQPTELEQKEEVEGKLEDER